MRRRSVATSGSAGGALTGSTVQRALRERVLSGGFIFMEKG
jgi:hypothetical protein